MSTPPGGESPTRGTILLSDINEEGETIAVRRRLSSLVNKDTSRAFSEVSTALELNLSELVVDNPREKKLLAANFNRWLSDRTKKGTVQLRDVHLTHVPIFISGLKYDCNVLDLQFNDLVEVSDVVCALNNLTHLNVAHNLLGGKGLGSIPNNLKLLPQLSRLSLGDNQLKDIPMAIIELKQLKWLDLEDNLLEQIPEEITTLPNLIILDLRYNEISYIPDYISNMKQLSTLLLDGNVIIEPLPDSLFEMKHLTHLSLQSTSMEIIPQELFSLVNLKTLNLSHNSIAVIPEELRELKDLDSLNVAENRISMVPDAIGWLIKLNEFHMFGRMNTFQNIPEKQKKSLTSIRLYIRNNFRKDPELRALLFDEPQCENNIRWKTYVGPNNASNVVQGASIEKLIQLLTHEQFASLNYSRCFLLLYQTFCTPQDLLNLLILRFNCNKKESEDSEIASRQKIVCLRVLNSISKWMESHPSHFDEQMQTQLLQFISSMSSDDANKLKKVLAVLATGAPLNPIPFINSSNKPPPKPIIPSNSAFSITNIDPKEIARQACLMEFELLSAVRPEEFMNSNWTREDKADKAPELTRYIQYFNKFSSIVVSSIVKYKDTKQRVQVLSLFILVAEECRLYNNFNTVIEIVAALHSTPIHRLKITWKLLSNKLKIIWENLQALMSMENNFKNYRPALKEAAGNPLVPNIGVILKDLTFLNDGNPDYLSDNPELINFGKLRQLEEILEQLQLWKRLPYIFEKVTAIQSAIMSTDILDENEAYSESVVCEDRDGKTAAMRGEVVASPNNTVINLDLNLTKEQRELAEKCHHKWKDTQQQLGLTTGNEVTKSGYLLLREDGSWKRMWFTMQFPSLYYYTKQTDKRPTGVIKLLGVSVEKIGKKKNFAIVISHPKSKPYAIRGDDDKTSLSWYEELCKLVK